MTLLLKGKISIFGSLIEFNICNIIIADIKTFYKE